VGFSDITDPSHWRPKIGARLQPSSHNHDVNGDGGQSTDETDDPSLDEMRSALGRLDESDPDWAELQWHVAKLLHDRYLDDDNRADLTDALAHGRRAVAAMPPSPAHLHDLGLFIWSEVTDFPGEGNVEEYVELREEALTLADQGSELYGAIASNLATGLMSMRRRTAADVDRAVQLWQSLINSDTTTSDVLAAALANLAKALSGHDAAPEDRLRAIEFGRRAVLVELDDPEQEADTWFSLASALETAHDYGDQDTSLIEAIAAVRRGLILLGDEHDDYPGFTVNLASLLRQQSRESGDEQPLFEAAALVRDIALPDTPPEHPDFVFVRTMSAAVLSDLGYTTNDEDAVREAINLYRQAVDASDPDSDERGVGLVNLAATLRDAADQFGAPELLAEACDSARAALRIFTTPGVRRATALTSLSNSLRDQFMVSGTIDELHEALRHSEQALAMTPAGYREYRSRQTNLAVLLSDNYTETADLHDLDRAIDLYREALEPAEQSPRHLAERQNDLSLALRDRHEHSGDVADLDEALRLAEQAVASTDPASPMWAGYASNLGNALMERYEVAENPADLDRAITLFDAALADARGRTTEESGYATNLGLALATRAEDSDAASDFDLALESLTQSINLLPPDHSEIAYRISNHAAIQRQKSGLLAQFGDHEGAIAEAEQAVRDARDAVRLAGDSSARLLPALETLAQGLRWCRILDPERVDAQEIRSVQRRAAHLNQILPAQKFGQYARLAHDAQEFGDTDEAMLGYGQAVDLTTDVAWIGLSVHERQNLLDSMSETSSKAVKFAIDMGQFAEALAWADQIRSVLWRQGLLVRSIAAQRPDDQRRALSELISMAASPTDAPTGAPRLRERRRRIAHQEADNLQLPIPHIVDYTALQVPGTLVLLVPGETGSVALLVQDAGSFEVVDLVNARTAELAQQVAALRAACAHNGATDQEWTTADEMRMRHAIFDCLEWLWDHVAAPILDRIAATSTQSDRIWWSPLGEFALLPIHAAGRHPRKASQIGIGSPARWPSVADRATSSYLPTIRSFDRAPNEKDDPLRLLYVSTDGATHTLSHSADEHAAVRAALPNFDMTELRDEGATIDAVRAEIPKHRLLHITAHGEPLDSASLRSGFRLSDGVFSVGDLAECHVPAGELAVILACDSARGDVQLPNEALHVAGAAAQAGFAGVVATTMPVRDSSAVPVVAALYEAIHDATDGIDGLAAVALRNVVRDLRTSPETGADPLSWAPYAFFGWGK